MFAHIDCGAPTALRRPLSIMRCDSDRGWLEFLYRPVGPGLELLSGREAGEAISLIAPIGNGFRVDPARPAIIAIGGGVGIPPMLLLAQQLRDDDRFSPRVFMGSEVEFPLDIVPATLPLAGVPEDASHAVGWLEQCRIASRLASLAGFEGCHAGYVTELARSHIEALHDPSQIQVVACGPAAMLAAVADLAAHFDLPCQLALEEFMACGVGGCAGCTVRLETADGPAMKRVCVDGPVFEAREVYPEKFDR